MSPDRPLPLTLIRRQLIAHLDKPVAEVMERALSCLVEALDARAAFFARIDDSTFEIIAAAAAAGSPAIEVGLRLSIEDTFAVVEEADTGILKVADATKTQPFKRLAMRQRLGIVSYLGAPVRNASGELCGNLAVLGDGPRAFTEADQDLLAVVAGILAPRLEPPQSTSETQPRMPASVVRLASQDVKEPLAILRGYAQQLSNNEVPAAELAEVARRLARQTETVIRVADQVLLMSRLPLELAFTVRVSLAAVAHEAARRIRERAEGAGMELRLQIDSQSEVWGDAALLEAALDEMLQNVFDHARSATVIQLRVRQSAADRLQLIVKDDGPGISAERLGELFGPLPATGEQPSRGHGLGLYLLRRVAAAHGGRTWANSLEGKGTTFYLELPAASPDGKAERASLHAKQRSA
jgi:signal transduction histidine kinase